MRSFMRSMIKSSGTSSPASMKPFGLHAERGLILTAARKDVAGRDMAQTAFLDELRGLRALAGTRAPSNTIFMVVDPFSIHTMQSYSTFSIVAKRT